MSRAALAAAFALAACAEPPPDEPPAERLLCRERLLGDAGAPPEVALVALDGDALVDADAENGAPVTGDRALLSVRARGLDGCTVALAIDDGARRTGTLVELVTGDADDGWGAPDPRNTFGFVAVPLARGAQVTLRVDVEDAAGRAASLTQAVRGY